MTAQESKSGTSSVVKSKFIKICLSQKSYICISYLPQQAHWQKNYHTFSIPLYLTYPNLATMLNTSVPQHQIETQASNKLAHPGEIVKHVMQCQTLAKVCKKHETKAKAKAAHEEAKQ